MYEQGMIKMQRCKAERISVTMPLHQTNKSLPTECAFTGHTLWTSHVAVTPTEKTDMTGDMKSPVAFLVHVEKFQHLEKDT